MIQKLITVDEALALLDENLPDWGEESVALSEANGCIFAQDIIAPTAHPAHPMSVMDGYALRQSDRKKILTVIGESRAGVPFEGNVNQNEAVRIFTGALIPDGANQVEIQENAIVGEDKTVRFPFPQSNRIYIRPAGSDFKKGDVLFREGERITPDKILALATCNLAKITVKKMPTIGLLSSGDELKPVGSNLKAGEIVNSILPALTARLNQWGLKAIDLGIARDNPNIIRKKFENCKADIIVPIGAASVGDYDLMKPTALELGYTPVFSKVAVKPGKPVWFFKCNRQRILGLPGNPSSAWVTSHIFLYYFIFGELPWRKAKLAETVAQNGPRETYLRARILPEGKVSTLHRQDSGLVTPLAKADCLLKRPANGPALKEDEVVDILVF